ncbi:MAG: PepSY-associated TM helix domain-containing protein [Porticoccaceae bacterium]|nr:PepSY-associated TM helix domain-containing protein [Porticoccaceae bacterium]
MPKGRNLQSSKVSSPRRWARWHRRIGLSAALLVLVLAITGIMLNHTSGLGLDKHSPPAAVVSLVYGIEAPELVAFPLASNWLSASGSQLFLNDEPLLSCSGSLSGAVALDSDLVVACEGELLLLNHSGDLLERIGASLGLPLPVNGLGLDEGRGLVLQNGDYSYRADLTDLSWQLVSSDAVAWSQPQPLPQKLQRQLAAYTPQSDITWERLLLDIHSGRVLGVVGVWLMDLAALALILLSITGFVMWRHKRRLGA